MKIQISPRLDNLDHLRLMKLWWTCALEIQTCSTKAKWAKDQTTWAKVITCMHSSLHTACIHTDSQATTTAHTNTLHPSSSHLCHRYTNQTSNCPMNSMTCMTLTTTKRLRGRKGTARTQIKCNICCKSTPRTQLGPRRPAREFPSRAA